MIFKWAFLFITVLGVSCISYRDLSEMKLNNNSSESTDNLVELIEILEEPCEDPLFYSNVMDTAAVLERNHPHNPALLQRYENIFHRIINDFDDSEIEEWEVKNPTSEIIYLKTLALQKILNRRRSADSVEALKKYSSEINSFNKKQLLIYINSVQRNIETVKNVEEFANTYLKTIFFTRHHFTVNEMKIILSQADSILNRKSAFLIGSISNAHKVYPESVNPILEYALQNDFDFNERYSTADFLEDLSSYNFKDQYQLALRENLYLKLLNFRKMNALIKQSQSDQSIELNERLLSFTADHSFKGNRNEYIKNTQLLFRLSRGENPSGRKIKAMLLRIAPGMYMHYLMNETQDHNCISDFISIYKIYREHEQSFTGNNHSYSLNGSNYLNPDWIFPDVKSELEKYLSSQFKIMSGGLASVRFDDRAVRRLTSLIQAYKLADMDFFKGPYNQVETVKKLLSQADLKFYQTVFPYLTELSETETVSLFIDFLNNRKPLDWQLQSCVRLYEISGNRTKTALKNKMTSLLSNEISRMETQKSLQGVQLAFRLKLNDKNLKNLIYEKWPSIKVLEKGEEK